MARGVPADDIPLTAEQRKFLGIPAKPKSQRQRKRPSRAGTGDGQPCPGTCACGERFETFTAWERHTKQSGCTQWRTDLEALRCTHSDY